MDLFFYSVLTWGGGEFSASLCIEFTPTFTTVQFFLGGVKSVFFFCRESAFFDDFMLFFDDFMLLFFLLFVLAK